MRTHPSGIVETSNYNTNGYLASISAGGATRFTVTTMNARQQITAATYGSSLGFPPLGEREGGFWIGGDAYSAPAVAVKQGVNTTWYYLLRDYLGNITHVVNTSNTVTAEYSYDAWGRRRDKDDWSYTLSGEPELLAGRSFTSHEYLPEFNLINMNGRLYDPLPGRFLSLDNYVQMPDNTQNFNRYSYCLNNPLVYTDPDGEIIFTLLAALIPGAQPLLPLAIAADIGGIINTANNWEHVNNAYDNNFFSGIGKMFGYYGVGAGKAAATYYGGPLGTVASSYGGDALNSLLVDGTLNNFHPDVTTQNLFVDIAVSQLGIGNSLGDAVSKNIGNELLKNTTKQLISQNVDGLISNIGVRTWQTGSIKDGLGSGWQDYTKGGGWWKYSLSSLGQGIMDTYDSQTIARNKTREAMKDYYKGNKSFSGFNYPNQPGTWMESLYYSQMKANTTLNLRLYSPTRNFFSTTLPRWYYPELYNY